MVEADPRPVGILVLGMHRSGTSAVTGVLDLLGIPAAGELLDAETYNERGLFENKAVNLFHERLLGQLGSRWDDPMALSNGFVETPWARAFVAELADIARAELAPALLFAVKDPRMCRFVPLWKAVLGEVGIEPRAILALRHPLEVAGSLGKRDGFPRAKSLLLWLDSMLAAERETRAMPRCFVSYDALLGDWRGETDRIAADLDIAWPKERARIEDTVDRFLTQDLRHHAAKAEIGRATRLEALVADSWDAFQALTRNRDDADAMAALDAVSQSLDAAAAVFAPYVAWEFRALQDKTERVAWLEEIERVVRAESAGYFGEIARLNAAIQAEREAAETAHSAHLAREQRGFRQEIARRDGDLQALRREAERTAEREAFFEAETVRLDAALGQLGETAHRQLVALDAIRASGAWRATAPLRRAGSALPPALRLKLRRLAKLGWWTLTPWRMPARLRFLAERERGPLLAPPAPEPRRPPPRLPAERRPARGGLGAHPALGVFAIPDGAPRLTMVTDSINEGSLFGGVATALIFAALLAERTGRRLRVVTRNQPPAAENVATVFRAHGIDWRGNIEFVFADVADAEARIEVHSQDVFLTTSWWTTVQTRQSIADERIVYILQEDERMFYPFGDDWLACAETIGDRRIAKVVNSALLHRHLAADGVIGADTPFFEPSFPSRIYHPDAGRDADGRRNFFFYARPHNARNLYARGVEVIETAIARGILDPALWNIHFVGKDLGPVELAGGVRPILLQNMEWEDYAAFVRSVDLALTLMYTPHPSYPPLDVAACGGVAVTNRFGVKTDLSGYSRSILCVDSETETLVEGLRLGVERALDAPARAGALADSGILRDWRASFAPVLDDLAPVLDDLAKGVARVR